MPNESLMKEAINILLISLLFCTVARCQDILSLVSPFFGSAVGGTGGGGSFGNTGSLIQPVANFLRGISAAESAAINGEGDGQSGLPFQEFVKLGTDIGQQLLRARASEATPKPPPILLPAPPRPSPPPVPSPPPPPVSPHPPPPLPLPIPLPAPVSRIITARPETTIVSTSPQLLTKHPTMGGNEDYDLVVGDLLGTTRAPPPPPSRFLQETHGAQRAQAFAIPQYQFSQQQPQRQYQQRQKQQFFVPIQHSAHYQKNARPHHQPQQLFQFQASPQKQPAVFNFQSAVPHYNDAIKQATGFGQDVIRQQLQPIYDGTETGRNRPISKNLFESDIVLTLDQLKGIVLAEKEKNKINSRRRNKRKVITGSVYRWPKDQPIPYEFASSDEKWRNAIRSALAFWQRETCVRWQENGPGHDRVVFFRGSGCYSSVGRTGGRQEISIGYGCEDLGIVTHEVGHSLGFWHEQSRPDRDQYIILRNEYIARGTEGNFVKRSDLESDSVGVPFDLGSVMHYGPNAFTINWDHATIETVDKRYSRTIGQRYGPSFIDVKQMNRLYCNDKCAGTTVTCQHGGYADPNNCLTCKCPTGLGGPTCASVQPSDCGAELIATGAWQQLFYRGIKKCYWRIRTNNARIRIVLESAKFRCDTTCQAYVEIKHNSDFQQTGFRKCCGEEEIEVLSEQAEALIIFDSLELGQDGAFSLRYIQDAGKPLPKPPPPVWIPGSENRLFRGLRIGKGGPVEKFILNAIPKIRDPQRPAESIASIVTEFTLGQILG